MQKGKCMDLPVKKGNTRTITEKFSNLTNVRFTSYFQSLCKNMHLAMTFGLKPQQTGSQLLNKLIYVFNLSGLAAGMRTQSNIHLSEY